MTIAKYPYFRLLDSHMRAVLPVSTDPSCVVTLRDFVVTMAARNHSLHDTLTALWRVFKEDAVLKWTNV